MRVEFVLVQASALFVAAFAFGYSAWWPLRAFGCPLLGKRVVVFDSRA